MNPITQIGESIPDALGNKIVTSQESVTGGTLYITSIINREGSVAVTQDFVPTSIAGSQRFLALTNAKSAVRLGYCNPWRRRCWHCSNSRNQSSACRRNHFGERGYRYCVF